jgi:hypothetical protein
MFGLLPEDDVQLGEWMQSRMQLAVWTPKEPVILRDVEHDVKSTWLPPLNLDLETHWRGFVRDERAKLTAQARSYGAVNQ